MQNQLNKIYELIQEYKQERELNTEIQRARLVGNICEEVAKYSRAQNDSVLIVLTARVYLAIDKLGHNPYTCISEVIKEIS